MTKKISVRKAVLIGTLVVNGPVTILMFAPAVTFLWLIKIAVVSEDQIWLVLLIFAASFVFAWLSWPISIVKWRLWAFESVDDIQQLKIAAVAIGLTWPNGHMLSKTELKSKSQTAREMELDKANSGPRGEG
jgi:hypothetical protein